MKTIILIVSALLSSSVILNGQDLKKQENPPVDRELQDLLEKFDHKKGEFKAIVPDLKKPDLLDEFNKRFNPDSTLTEQFPGASRYYAKRPVLAPYGKFIIEPDTSVKYYLIIVDPLRHTVTK